MLMADTVMDADEPRFQIGEDEMDDRQIVLGNLWVAALGNGKVFIPALAEAGISTPIVSDGQRPRSNGALHEPTKRVGAPIGYYGEPDTPGIASVLSLVLRGSRFPMTNLDGTSDENLVVDTPAFAASPSTNPCLVYLNMFPRLAADTILIGPHHASAELAENAEGRLIARQAKLSLKLNRRDAGRLAGDQISRPKPCAQRHMAAFHDGANRQARIVAALATAQDTGTSGDAEGIACGMAMRTDEAVAPSSFFHVGSTLRFIGKKLLKLWKRPRKGQVVTLKDVHGSLSIIHTKSIPSGCVRQADRQETTIGVIRDSFSRLFPDVELNSLGDPLTNGTFRFTKGMSKGFLFKNLSGGEKEAFDLILDFVVARSEYDNTVFCIDEPESHMNTRLQAELLSVLYDLTPKSCQLIFATHSIGMMRRARDIKVATPGSVAFLDFGDRDFDLKQVIVPTQPTRAFWEKAYTVALDDLANLIAPSQVVICDGAPKTRKSSPNQGHDAKCYNCIFQEEFPETRFISGGNVNDISTDRFVLYETLVQLVSDIAVVRLIDRDDRSSVEIEEEQARGMLVLSRRNLESYLFDDEVLTALAKAAGKANRGAELLSQKSVFMSSGRGAPDDLKPVRGEIYNACKKLLELTSCGNTAQAFMRISLAPLVQPGLETYRQLKQDIFVGPVTN